MQIAVNILTNMLVILLNLAFNLYITPLYINKLGLGVYGYVGVITNFISFLLFVFFKDTKKYSKYILIFSLLAAGGMASGGIIRILGFISSFGLSSDQGMSYLSGWLNATTRLGFLITYFVVFVIYLILFIERRYRKKHMVLPVTKDSISENLLAYIFTIGIMLPLLYVNVTFDRLF